MTISIDYGNTNIIYIPQADLTPVSGTLYDFDTTAFHSLLRDLEDNEIGQVFPTTHTYVSNDTIAGSTDFAKVIIRDPYSVEFENGLYSVRLQGTNNNIFDVGAGILVQNSVQIIPSNSFGNTVTSTGSGLSPTQDAKLTAIPDNPLLDDDTRIDDIITDLTFVKDIEGGKWEIVGTQMIFYKDDNTTEVARFNIDDVNAPKLRTRV